MALRVLTLPRKTIPAPPPRETAAAGFDFPTTQVGKTADGNVTVLVDPALGQAGLANATALLAAAQVIFAQTAAWFGIAGQPVNAIVCAVNGSTDGTGGAYHYSCTFDTGGDLYIDAAFGIDAMVEGLFEAELSECFMGAQNKGWNCGGSGGEALSRWLAEAVSGGPGGALAAFSSAPTWDQAGRPNWVDQDQGTDGDYPSIGCGMVYISWVKSLGHDEAAICQAGGATLAANYKALTGKDTAWVGLTAALAGVSITNDDPFAGATPQPQPGPTPPPGPTPSPAPVPPPGPNPPSGNVIDEILANPHFRAGVEAYQASRNLKVDGRIGTNTLRQIGVDMAGATPQPAGGATPQQVAEVVAMINDAITNDQAALDVLSGKMAPSRPFP